MSETNDLHYADTLWKAADALRGQVDAAEYKHVVLGLRFLKYISDAFEASETSSRATTRRPNRVACAAREGGTISGVRKDD